MALFQQFVQGGTSSVQTQSEGSSVDFFAGVSKMITGLGESAIKAEKDDSKMSATEQKSLALKPYTTQLDTLKQRKESGEIGTLQYNSEKNSLMSQAMVEMPEYVNDIKNVTEGITGISEEESKIISDVANPYSIGSKDMNDWLAVNPTYQGLAAMESEGDPVKFERSIKKYKLEDDLKKEKDRDLAEQVARSDNALKLVGNSVKFRDEVNKTVLTNNFSNDFNTVNDGLQKSRKNYDAYASENGIEIGSVEDQSTRLKLLNNMKATMLNKFKNDYANISYTGPDGSEYKGIDISDEDLKARVAAIDIEIDLITNNFDIYDKTMKAMDSTNAINLIKTIKEVTGRDVTVKQADTAMLEIMSYTDTSLSKSDIQKLAEYNVKDIEPDLPTESGTGDIARDSLIETRQRLEGNDIARDIKISSLGAKIGTFSVNDLNNEDKVANVVDGFKEATAGVTLTDSVVSESMIKNVFEGNHQKLRLIIERGGDKGAELTTYLKDYSANIVSKSLGNIDMLVKQQDLPIVRKFENGRLFVELNMDGVFANADRKKPLIKQLERNGQIGLADKIKDNDLITSGDFSEEELSSLKTTYLLGVQKDFPQLKKEILRVNVLSANMSMISPEVKETFTTDTATFFEDANAVTVDTIKAQPSADVFPAPELPLKNSVVEDLSLQPIPTINEGETKTDILDKVKASQNTETTKSIFELASGYVGMSENDKKAKPVIQGWFDATGVKGDVESSDGAWCAAFVNHVLNEAGLASVDEAKAWSQSYKKIGNAVDIDKMKQGDIVVFSYGEGKGHVGFFEGYTDDGKIKVLGGNQRRGFEGSDATGGAVTISEFSRKDIVATRRPVPLGKESTDTIREVTNVMSQSSGKSKQGQKVDAAAVETGFAKLNESLSKVSSIYGENNTDIQESFNKLSSDASDTEKAIESSRLIAKLMDSDEFRKENSGSRSETGETPITDIIGDISQVVLEITRKIKSEAAKQPATTATQNSGTGNENVQ